MKRTFRKVYNLMTAVKCRNSRTIIHDVVEFVNVVLVYNVVIL